MSKWIIVFVALFIGHAAEASKCGNWQKSLEQRMLEANSCWEDSDCTAVAYGCPFFKGQCHVYLTGKENKAEREAIRADVANFHAECIKPNPVRLDACAIENALNSQCEIEHRLSCHNGKCITATHILLENRFESKDAYGSRQVIE